MVLEHQPDVDAKLTNGETPLLSGLFSFYKFDNCNFSLIAFFAACYRGHYDMAMLLLEHGADINVKLITGATALMAAIRCNNTTLVKALLDRKADIAATDDSGDTPLHYAYVYKSLPIIRELESRGADAEAKNNLGQRPHEVTKKVAATNTPPADNVQ